MTDLDALAASLTLPHERIAHQVSGEGIFRRSGLFDFDLVSAIFGQGANETAPSSAISRVVYILVALSALWQIKVLAERAGSKRSTTTLR